MDRVWATFVLLDGLFMPLSLWTSEDKAVAAVRHPLEGVCLLPVDQQFPEFAVELEKIYWPMQEKYENSRHHKFRSEAQKVISDFWAKGKPA